MVGGSPDAEFPGSSHDGDSSSNREASSAVDAHSSAQWSSQPRREQVLGLSLFQTLVECASDSEDEGYIRGSVLSQKLDSDPHMFSDGESTTDLGEECSSTVSSGDTQDRHEKRVGFYTRLRSYPLIQ